MKYTGYEIIEKEVSCVLKKIGFKKSDLLVKTIYFVVLFIFIAVAISTLVIAYYKVFQNNEVPVYKTVNTGIRQTANDNKAPVSQTVNVNQESKYIWRNKADWKAEMQEDEKYEVYLIFAADGSITPIVSCLHISSDAKAESLSSETEGVPKKILKKESSSEEYVECFTGLKNFIVVFKVYFQEKPTKIDAQLIKPDFI